MQGYTEQKQIQQQRTVEAVHHASPREHFSLILGIALLCFTGFPFSLWLFSYVWSKGNLFGYVFVICGSIFELGLFGVGCVFLWTTSSNMWHNNYNVMIGRNIVAKGDIVVRVHDDGTYDNFTKEVVEASLLPEPKDEPTSIFTPTLQEEVLNLHCEHVGRPTILESLKPKYPKLTDHQIKKIIYHFEDQKQRERERMLAD